MEAQYSYKRYNADIMGTYVVTYPYTLEEEVLIVPFARRFQVDPSQQMPILQLAGFQENFYMWYDKVEHDRQIFIDNIRSGKDKPRTDTLLPFLKEKVSCLASGINVFDIGCGTGEAVLPYLPKDVHYIGIDSSRKSLSELIRRFKRGRILNDRGNVWRTYKRGLRVAAVGALPASLPVLANVPLSNYTIASMVLHHVPSYDVRQAINSLSQITKRRGKLLLITFDSDKREGLDAKFSKITEQTETFTRGSYQLPGGTLPDEYIYFHNNGIVEQALREDFGKTTSYPLGEFFRFFEARKTRK